MGDIEAQYGFYHYQFINNVIGEFYSNLLNWVGDTLYPRFKNKVIGTYDKAVEYYLKLQEDGREEDKPYLPFVALNPSGELLPSGPYGKALWRYPHLGRGLGAKLYDPIYEDQNVKVCVVFSRIEGEIELIMWMRSIYEYLDLRVFLLQMFGGMERPIYPNTFNSFLILPNEVYNYTYDNPYTGEHYTLDWDSYNVHSGLVKSTNTQEWIYPIKVKPQISITSLADGSERYGGTDKVAEYRVTATLKYEIELPTYMEIQTDFLAERMNLNINFGSSYTAYPDTVVPVNILTSQLSNQPLDTTNVIVYEKGMVLNNRFYHVVTQQEADSTSNVIFDLPADSTNVDLIYVNSRYGKMDYKDHYDIINSGTQIEIFIDNVTLVKGMVIELYYYHYLYDTS
jgi:hypothetical protein